MPGKRPAVWGPLVWRWVHVTARKWDEAGGGDPEVLVRALTSLMGVLPCRACRDSYSEFFRCLRPLLRLMAEARQAEEWAHLLHSVVNAKLGKPSPSFEEARRLHAVGGSGHDDPLWPMEFAIALNYDDNGVSGRCRKHRDHFRALGELYLEIGDGRTGEALVRGADEVQGSMCTESVVDVVQGTFVEM
jgi:hypothetical protein